MNRILALVFAVAMLGTATTAMAQTNQVQIYTETTGGWVGDEPNTPAAGSLPFCQPRDHTPDPSCDYPADRNNLGAARVSSPAHILNAEFRHDVCVNRQNICYMNNHGLLTRLTGNNMLVPGLGQWWAWYGSWQDLNGDGWIDQHLAASRGEVSTRGDCQTTPRTDDPNGFGASNGANTGVSARCIPPQGNEWTGINNQVIVGYITPGDYNEGADFVNQVADNETEKPDMYFQGRIVEGQQTGWYYGPTTNFDYVLVDSSLLETTVIEVIQNPETIQDGDRLFEAQDASLVDVDVFTSVDPAVEGLYQNLVITPLTANGCDVEFTVIANACPVARQRTGQTLTETIRGTPAQAVIDDLQGASPTTDPLVGPVEDIVFPPWTNEGAGVDYSSPHIYFDQRLVWGSTSVSGVGTHNQNQAFGSWATPTDSKYRALSQTEIHAQLGIWKDTNGDGIIGTWADDDPQDGCPDKYDCGMVEDPNAYTFETSDGEFQPLCGAKDAAAAVPNAAGSYIATVTSSTGNWGAGVYVLTDRRSALNQNSDTLRDDGRSPFNPYDDLVFDVADDGDVDSIVTSGPIRIHMLCSGAGFYVGYERMIFLEGTNVGYDVKTVGTANGNFVAQGVPAGESSTDEDVYPAFTL